MSIKINLVRFNEIDENNNFFIPTSFGIVNKQFLNYFDDALDDIGVWMRKQKHLPNDMDKIIDLYLSEKENPQPTPEVFKQN